ncbi:hypothetical protein B9479_004904 [Cryptococcus floricola]|uniref:Reverse transcriptase Ty1/copia-type domain-containing protein n=1 Tax=Cryptococcus floricola TaxID=2591691 RepID=A0A5D3AWJ7_9TREE|nr:hypothetical protein B9479_004904 [Cryptococcus floricola]
MVRQSVATGNDDQDGTGKDLNSTSVATGNDDQVYPTRTSGSRTSTESAAQDETGKDLNSMKASAPSMPPAGAPKVTSSSDATGAGTFPQSPMVPQIPERTEASPMVPQMPERTIAVPEKTVVSRMPRGTETAVEASQMTSETHSIDNSTSMPTISHTPSIIPSIEVQVVGDGTIPVPRRSERLATTNLLLNKAAFVMSTTTVEPAVPSSFREAMSSPAKEEWRKAINREMEMLVGKKTLTEMKLPEGRKAVNCRWVFAIKRDSDGNVVKYKARLVAKGFTQIPGVDFDETFAPVSRTTSIRILFTIAAAAGLAVRHGDFEGAYINSKLDKDIYMSVPEGLSSSVPGQVLRLERALYGLKQSGRTWWLVLSEQMEKLGFKRLEEEWGMYVLKEKGETRCIAMIYVDDILVAARTAAKADDILDRLGKKWVITKMGDAQYILGLKVERDLQRGKVYLSQQAYIDKVSATHLDQHTRIYNTPLPIEMPTPLNSPAADQAKYQKLVGILPWLANCTRPDIAFATSILSRNLQDPRDVHLKLALRVLSYVRHTKERGLELGKNESEQKLEVFADADFGGDFRTKRSTSGFVVYFMGSVINWSSKRQPTIATSTMEAEYIATFAALLEILWLRSLLKSLGFAPSGPTRLNCDNKSTIHFASHPSAHQRTKHIDIKYHKIRECIALGVIDLRFVPTSLQKADVLTKALGKDLHYRMMDDLKLRAKGNGEKKRKSTVAENESALRRARV